MKAEHPIYPHLKRFAHGEISPQELRRWCDTVLRRASEPVPQPVEQDWQKVNRVVLDLVRRHGKEKAGAMLEAKREKCAREGDRQGRWYSDACLGLLNEIDIE